MKKQKTLYNMMFPIWSLWIIPVTWIVVLPANFLVDLLVVVLTMTYLKIPDIKQNVKAVILRVWLMDFVADFIGSVYMFLVTELDFGRNDQWWEEIRESVFHNPLQSIGGFIWTTISVLFAAVFLYFINTLWCLEKAGLNDSQRKKLALSIAIFTAPYICYLPTDWFY